MSSAPIQGLAADFLRDYNLKDVAATHAHYERMKEPCENCHRMVGHTVDCVEGYELWDNGNKLVRCTPGTSTCYEIGKWLGIDPLRVSSILSQTKARTIRGKIGIAVWRMANGEEKTSKSYSAEFKDFLVNEAIRKRLIKPGVRHGSPERMKRCDEA